MGWFNLNKSILMNYSHIAQLGRQAAMKQAADPAPKEYPSSEFGKVPPVFKRRAGTPPLSWPDYSENPDVVPTVSDNPKYPIIKANLPPGYTDPKSGIRSENYDAPFLHGYPRNDIPPAFRGSQRGLGPLVDSKQHKIPWPLYGHWLDPTPPEGSLKLDVEGDTQFQPKSYDFLKKERKERWEWEQKEEVADRQFMSPGAAVLVLLVDLAPVDLELAEVMVQVQVELCQQLAVLEMKADTLQLKDMVVVEVETQTEEVVTLVEVVAELLKATLMLIVHQ